MALFDFYTDWANSITLLQSMMCYQRIFGAMMMLTIILLPMIFAFFQPNYDEMRFHERWLRKSKAHFFRFITNKVVVFFRHTGKINPYVPYEPGRGSKALYNAVFWCFVVFSPATHVVSQVWFIKLDANYDI